MPNWHRPRRDFKTGTCGRPDQEALILTIEATPSEQARTRHRDVLELITELKIPFLVGGGYALRYYTGDVRGTRDLDLFVRRGEVLALLGALSRAGLETDLLFPHWLGKAYLEGESIDIIYSSGNGLAEVDDEWFIHSVPAPVLGIDVRLCPPEEIIWSKAFVMERERYDGADISHLIRACHERLDWCRLIARFGRHWRVLFSHLILFGFVYPGERACIPVNVMSMLCRRLDQESRQSSPPRRLCQGTLLSREQYLTDVSGWGYADARLAPDGAMSAEDVAQWTAAIENEKGGGDAGSGHR